MSHTSRLTIAELVRNDYRTADVFKKWGINYCCGGTGTLDEVCTLRQLDKQAIAGELHDATQNVQLSNGLCYDQWPVDFLADYIVHVHHAYVKETGARLQQSLLQYAAGHKMKYPHFVAVESAYNTLLGCLEVQMEKEEKMIFPYLKALSRAHRQKEICGATLPGTLQKPPGDPAGAAYKEIETNLVHLRNATNSYRFPEDACTAHQVIYHKLHEFDADLLQHRKMENSFLFPAALQLEKDLLLL